MYNSKKALKFIDRGINEKRQIENISCFIV